MPVLDLIGDPLPDSLVVEGRMAFVGNDTKYSSYVACKFARIASGVNGLDAKVEIPNLYLRAILNSPPVSDIDKEYKDLIKKGLFAGIVLDTIYTMVERKLQRPSVNKGIYVAEVLAKEMDQSLKSEMKTDKTIISSTRINKYWASFKPVSTLWAAKYILLSERNVTPPAESLTNFLALSEMLRLFGEAYTPVGSKVPLFAPGECWSPPEGYDLPPVNALLQNEKDKRLEEILADYANKKAWENN